MNKIVKHLKYLDGKLKKTFLTLFLLHLDFRSRKIVFRPPQNEEELRAMYRLRYRVYCQEYKFLSAKNYPDGQEKDEFDNRSEYILAVQNSSQIIGCVRLIKPAAVPFPTEKEFNVKNVDKQRTVEISRLIVERPYRSTKVGIGLYRGIYHKCVELGYTFILEAMEKELARWINYLFLRFIPISIPQKYFGTLNIAFIADVHDISEAVKIDNPLLHRYLNTGLPHQKSRSISYAARL